MKDDKELNFEYLIKIKTHKELKSLAKELGFKNVSFNSEKKLNKIELANMIINNSNFKSFSKEEIYSFYKLKKNKYYKDLPNRIYSKCKKKENDNYDTPCLEFNGRKDIDGYIRVSILNNKVAVHRVSYALSKNIFVEDIPKFNEFDEMLEVCHGCGCDKSCIEPSHLKLKSKSQNQYEDKIRDCTLTQGEKNYFCKISEELATKIKHSKGDGRTQKQRSIDYEVTIGIISSIDRNQSWMHIPDKNGNIKNNIEKRIRISKKRKNDKEKVFTKEEYKQALKRLKNKSNLVLYNKEFDTPCWCFSHKLDDKGYGRITFKGYRVMAHVLAYESIYGKKDKNKIILHKCNNKSCCNPDHLSLGTFSENSIDSVQNNQKGVKLSEDDVRKIKILLKEGKMTQKEIAEKYNISRRNVSGIKTEKIWKHIKIDFLNSDFIKNNNMISIYTDGSCLTNPGPGGWGFVVVYPDGFVIVDSGGDPSTTNNKMELKAIIEALKYIDDDNKNEYTIFSDSMYCVNCATGKWGRKANLELWSEYDKEIKNKKIKFEWVKAHNGNKYNEMVDKIAFGEAKKIQK